MFNSDKQTPIMGSVSLKQSYHLAALIKYRFNKCFFGEIPFSGKFRWLMRGNNLILQLECKPQKPANRTFRLLFLLYVSQQLYFK